MGGKYRIARHIAEVIERVRLGRNEYVEPFVGGAAVAARVAPRFDKVRLSDVVPDLILMWQAVLDGWEPPEVLSEETWRKLRSQPPSALRGFAGFGCSFGGRFFEGYARQSIAGGKPAVETSLAPSARRSVLRKKPAIEHAQIELLDYRDVKVDRGCVVYADPPYEGTKPYRQADRQLGVGRFNTLEFWEVAAGWVGQGAAVVVSEQAAPPGWIEVWRAGQPSYLRGDQKPDVRTERVFVDPRSAHELAW